MIGVSIMNFNFILADGNMVTSSFTVAPLNYPTVNGYKTVDGDIITGSASPATINLLPNNYKIQNNLESTNDWYIAVTTSSFSIISGSTITASLCAVTFNLEDITDTNTSASVAITPIYKNVVYSGSFVMGDTVNHATDPTGSLTVNLVPMPYHVSVTGIYRNTKFKIYPTGSSVNANQCIVTGTNVNNTITPQNNAIYGYTAQASDARYMLSGSSGNSFPDITDINGNVGINQTNPFYTLDVNGNIGNSNGNALSLGRFNLLTLGDNPNSDNFNLYFDGSDNGYFKYVAMNLNFLDSGDNSILFLNSINSGGLVGINQTNPQSTLDVSGSINFDGELLNNGSVYVPVNATSASYAPNLLPDITDDTVSQCVGINNSNPLTTLDVNGTIANTTETGLTIDSYGNDLNINITNGYNFNLNAFAREPLVINEQDGTWNIESTSSINLATQGNLLFTGNSFGFNRPTPQVTLDLHDPSGTSTIQTWIGDNLNINAGNTPAIGNPSTLTFNQYGGNVIVGGTGTPVVTKLGVANSNPQYTLDVTGNGNISGNLTVGGTLNASSISSSTVYITSSNLIITDAYAILNASTPHQQYTGIQFYDSGSTTNKSYLTWDGLNDYLFISSSDGGYQRRIILGPDNNGVLTSGYIPVATGSNGLINSVISQSGTTVGVAGTIQLGNANYSASVIAVSGTQSTFTASCGASAALTQFALKAGNGSGQATIKTSGGGLTIDSAGNISGSSIITAPTFIGSLTGTATTASYVNSASYAPTIIPSQLSVTAITASTHYAASTLALNINGTTRQYFDNAGNIAWGNGNATSGGGGGGKYYFVDTHNTSSGNICLQATTNLTNALVGGNNNNEAAFQATFNVSGNTTYSTQNQAFYPQLFINVSGSTTGSYRAMRGSVALSQPMVNTVGSIDTLFVTNQIQPSASINGYFNIPSWNAVNVAGLSEITTNTTSGSVGTFKGLYVQQSYQGYTGSNAVIGTSIGLQIDAQKGNGVSSGWGIYQAGTSDRNIFSGYTNFGAGNQGVNTMSVQGAAAIGASYYNVTAPTNGLIVQGKVGIGSNNPVNQLDVNGNISASAITASTSLAYTGLTMPYSSSLNALTPLVMTGSHYLYTSASVNLMYVYNGSRWCSSSLA